MKSVKKRELIGANGYNGQKMPEDERAQVLNKSKTDIISDKIYRTPIFCVAAISAAAGAAFCLLAFLILLIFGLRIHTDRDVDGNAIRYFGIMNNGGAVFGTVYAPEGISGIVFGDTVKFSDGSKYKGEIKGLLFEGQGSYTSPEGDVYKGSFVDGLLVGDGEILYADGSTFSGKFENGKRNGYGEYTAKDGSSYKGNYQNDEKSGYGVFTYADGSVYSGYFENDMRHGQGSYRFACKDSYTGEFRNNVIWGKGSYFFASGRVFSGEFRNGVPVN